MYTFRFALSISLMASSVLTGAATQSPAELKIAEANAAIAKDSKRADSYSDLALALARRARETSDTEYYVKADEALKKSFAIAPDNFAAQKVKVWILLGNHEFAEALKLAQKLNTKTPDDVLVYGFIADAQVELGNYAEAEKAVQWMLDLRPGNIPALTRAAYLRELFGDVDGALEFMNQAYQRMRPEETEDRAWVLTQIGHLQLAKGNNAAADRTLAHALKTFPDYHYALGNLAKVRIAQQNYSAAADLFKKRYDLAPHPENLFEVAEALEKAGKQDEAKAAFAKFETEARAEMNGPDNSNRELIFYYLDHAKRADEGLRIAKREASLRQDVFTLHAYSWALFQNGEVPEARKQIEKALAVGIKDARMLYHAGLIAAKLEDTRAAAKYLKQSLAANPESEVSGDVQKALAANQPQAGNNK